MVAIHGAQGHKSFKEAFADAKKAGKKKFTWSKNKREYTTVTKEEREKDFKRETRREKYKRKESTGEGGGLTEFQGKFKTEQQAKGANVPFEHKGKKFTTDVVGDKPQREQIDTMVMANKGGRVGLTHGSAGVAHGRPAYKGKKGDERVKKQIGGRANLLEEVGRIDAERMNPNRRAEKARVIGELNRGYKHGKRVTKKSKK